MGKYFGTDGIRGIAGESLTVELAYRVGLGVKAVFKPKRLVIGKDTRESSDALALAVATGAMQAGVDVLYAGTASTPMVAHYSREQKIPGVMITASHNLYQDNGIKVFDNGYKLKAKDEEALEARLDSGEIPQAERFGSFYMSDEVEQSYEQLFTSLGLERANLSVAIDTAHGATHRIAKKVFADIVDEYVQIGDAPDGRNINAGFGSTALEAITKTAEANKSDIGLAFDGDGDRVLVVDHRENVYDGDLLIYILATYLKAKGELKKDTVVLTKMSNPGIVRALKDQGIKVVATDVGDKYVQAEMLKNGYVLGGENSGHLILGDVLQTGDGMVAAAYLLRILHETRRTLASLVEDVEIYPQQTVNVKDVDKGVVDDKDVKQEVKNLKKRLGTDSLLLVRPSGTEPVVRITVSHRDENLVEETIERLQALILKKGGGRT